MLQKVIRLISLVSLTLILTPATAFAATGAGTASLHFSPATGSYDINSTFTIYISETSSAAVASVEVDMSYPASQLQCVTVDTSASAFPSGFVNTCSNGVISLVRGVQGTTITGAQPIATITFKALSGSGNAVLTMANSSEIDDANVNNACDSSCAGGTIAAMFGLTTPAPAPAPQPAPTSSPTSNTNTTTRQSSSNVVTNAVTSSSPSAQAPASGSTLGDTHTKETISVDNSAKTLHDLGWINLAEVLAFCVALTALGFAAKSWLASHHVQIVVVSSKKAPAVQTKSRTRAKRSAKKSKK